LARSNRGKVDEYIRDMTSKQVAMEADNEWNKMSAEDAMVMAFVTMMDNDKPPTSSSSKPSSNPDHQNDNLTPEERQKRYEDRIPEWKKVAPQGDEPTTMIKNGKTYHWCTKCRNGKGMWALHKTEDHRGYSKPKSEEAKKKVSFQTDTSTESSKQSTPSSSKSTSSSKEKPSSGPSIQIKKELLTNAKAYLAQFQDFPKGGAQG
jgi:hypothetical protein